MAGMPVLQEQLPMNNKPALLSLPLPDAPAPSSLNAEI